MRSRERCWRKGTVLRMRLPGIPVGATAVNRRTGQQVKKISEKSVRVLGPGCKLMPGKLKPRRRR